MTNIVWHDKAKETIEVEVTQPLLRAYETRAGAVVIAGAVAHEPLGNGTLFPMVAVLPPGGPVFPPGDPAAHPPASASVGKPPLPLPASPPPGPGPARTVPDGGCAGCRVQPSQPGAPGWWVGLGCAWVLRRRARDERTHSAPAGPREQV